MKCRICKKRNAGKQEWKTNQEKETCLTCRVFDKFLTDTLTNLWKLAKNIDLDLTFSTRLEPTKKSTQQK